MNNNIKTIWILCLILGSLGWLVAVTQAFSLRSAELDRFRQAEYFAEQNAESFALLLDTRSENESLSEELRIEAERNEDLEDDNDDYRDRVEELKKITETDPQLLAKYSKIYFLNENYTPSDLDEIDSQYLLDPSRETEIHDDVKNRLENMLDKAADADIDIKVASAYRSFGTQAVLKAGYTVSYGAGANAFSADQGYSEHQLGTAVDLTIPGGTLTTAFENTEAFKWLQKNAYKYGFILSYPRGNSYYQYEPWHWRFVGTDLARKLNRDEKNFYDMDQRDINEYLGSLFD